MAKVLKEYERTPPGRPAIYPWDDWLDGRIWMIKQGEDFDSDINAMSEHIRRTAQRRGIVISVYMHDEETLVIKPRGE